MLAVDVAATSVTAAAPASVIMDFDIGYSFLDPPAGVILGSYAKAGQSEATTGVTSRTGRD
jgi:hypothetical protein